MNRNSSSVNFQGWCFTNCYSQGIYYKKHFGVILLLYTWKKKNWMSPFTINNLFQKLPAYRLQASWITVC